MVLGNGVRHREVSDCSSALLCDLLTARSSGVYSYNESYGLGKNGIRREKAGRYENQGVRTIFGARRVP